MTRMVFLAPALLLAGLALPSPSAVAEAIGDPRALLGAPETCSNSATIELQACQLGADSDYMLSAGTCLNIVDLAVAGACFDAAVAARDDDKSLCGEQAEERGKVCTQIGEAAFEPRYTADQFVDPNAIGAGVAPNPYFPLVQGMRWVYHGQLVSDEGEPIDEQIIFTITDRIKLVDGVATRVINDQVIRNGLVHEDTDDWYVQDRDGNVWYFGEAVKNYVVADGVAELDNLDGSWTAGVGGSRAGIIMLAHPKPGDVYRQEFGVGGPQDLGEVLSVTASEQVPGASCAETCLVTRDWTPVEPGEDAQKFYAPGIGAILELDSEGERVELIEFSKP